MPLANARNSGLTMAAIAQAFLILAQTGPQPKATPLANARAVGTSRGMKKFFEKFSKSALKYKSSAILCTTIKF